MPTTLVGMEGRNAENYVPLLFFEKAGWGGGGVFYGTKGSITLDLGM